MKGDRRLDARRSGGPPGTHKANRPPELDRAAQEKWEDEELLPDMTPEGRVWWLATRRTESR